MPLTRPSLFLRLKSNSRTDGWDEFASRYSAVLNEYARAYGQSEHDHKDIVQNVWLVLCRIMPNFCYCPSRGGFRHLLRKIVKNTAIDWLRRRGGTRVSLEFTDGLTSPPDRSAQITERWEILQRSLKVVRDQCTPLSWTCFERHVIERRPARDVGLDLGVTANAVYVNASRVLDRVRGLCLELEKRS